MKKKKIDVYQIATDKIIELLKAGTIPWRKPWTAVKGGLRPMNYETKRPYSGINFFLLLCAFENPHFLTFKQIQKMGGKVIKGEKSNPVFYWNWLFVDANGDKVKTEEEAKKKIPFLRYYNVFNATQIEGIEFISLSSRLEWRELNEKIDICESIVNGCKDLKLEFINKSKAFYSPSRDVVNMPIIEQFDDSPEYYSTLFHELGHWTGHESRLKRFKPGAVSAAFGSEEYSKEELIAEMCSTFLCFDCQIDLPKLVQNQAAYLSNWLTVLKADFKMVVMAAAQAEKAAKFIKQIT